MSPEQAIERFSNLTLPLRCGTFEPLASVRERVLSRGWLREHGMRNVQFGSGPMLQQGWLNVDALPLVDWQRAEAEPDSLSLVNGLSHYLRADLTKELPFEDASFENAYSEHLVEHLERADAVRWLAETRRIVQPGGVVRITTPDLGVYLRAYVEGDEAFFAERRRRLQGFGTVPERRAWMVNQLFKLWGHRWIYDESELRTVLVEAGFQADKIRRGAYREGVAPSVAALDAEYRADESLYVDAVV